MNFFSPFKSSDINFTPFFGIEETADFPFWEASFFENGKELPKLDSDFIHPKYN